MIAENEWFRATIAWFYGVAESAGTVTVSPWRRLRELVEGRAPYSYLRRTVRRRHERFRALDDDLNMAAMAVPYDVYVTRITIYAAIVTVLGFLGGLFLGGSLASLGLLATLSIPCPGPSGLCDAIRANKLSLQVAAFAFGGAVIAGFSAWFALYYRPRMRAELRRRDIEINLSSAIIFMYALSYGGASILQVMREIAEAEDAYGEVATEFDQIVRDVDLFGSTLNEAMRRGRGTTPSRSMRRFLDDFLNVIDSGGDITLFLKDESRRYLEEARREQEDYIDTLGLLGEIYATMFIAGPLLFLIILLVISFVGGATIAAVYVVIYLGIPLGVLSYSVLLNLLSGPFYIRRTDVTLTGAHRTVGEPPRGDPRYPGYRRTKAVARLRETFTHPLRAFVRRPTLAATVSVPAAAVALGLAYANGTTLLDVTTDPIPATTTLFVLPFVIATAPIAVFHEWRDRRRATVVKRFPDTLLSIANANDMGLPLPQAIDHVSVRRSDRLETELQRTKNDLDWNSDIAAALVNMANRLRVPQVSRTAKLLGEASKTTGDLNKVLSVAAEETRNRYLLERDRVREMSGYVAVIVISFLVYIGVVILLDQYYLAPLAAALSEQSVRITQNVGPIVTRLNVAEYRMVFYHSVLIQAVGNGLLAGKMSQGNLTAGLKWALTFIVISIVAFYGFVL